MPAEKLGIELEAIVRDLGQLKAMASDLKKIQTNAGLAEQKMAEFQRRTESLRMMRESFQSLNLVGAEMMAVSGGILAGFQKIGRGFVDAATEAEKFELTLLTLFKDAGRAKQELAWATEFAMGTPFELRDIIQATTMFRSFGLDAREYLGMAGDMAAAFGGSSDKFHSAVMGVAKAAASGAGALDILRESFGITGDQLKEFGWSGKEDLEGFRTALKKLLRERFEGGMEKLSKTFGGIQSNIRDMLWSIKREVGKPILEALTRDFGSILEFLKQAKASGEMQKWINTIKDIFMGIYNTIKDAAKFILPILKSIFEILSKHPEITKAAGKWLFLGSAFTLAAGAALFFSGMIGQSIISLLQLRLTLLQLPGVAGHVFGGLNRNIMSTVFQAKSLGVAQWGQIFAWRCQPCLWVAQWGQILVAQ